ncbi:MAG: ATP-binding cassette domain-containing protein, partial [Planctomycetota bacterium]
MQSAETALRQYQDQDWFQERLQRIGQRPPVLTIDGLSKVFHTPMGAVEALRAIDFAVHRREFVCVIGQSGCGKSTLIRTLAGLEQPSSGQVLLDGRPVSEPGPERGMVFQGYSL